MIRALSEPCDRRRCLAEFDRWPPAPDAQLSEFLDESGWTVFAWQGNHTLIEGASDAGFFQERQG